MSNKKFNVLFICNSFPHENRTAGSNLYKKIISSYGSENFLVISTDTVGNSDEGAPFQSLTLDLKNGFRSRISRKIAKWFSFLLYLYIRIKWFFSRRALVDEINHFRPDKLLICIRGNLLVIIRDLIEELEFTGKIVLYDSDTISPEKSRGYFMFKSINQNFNWLKTRASRVFLVSEEMKKHYRMKNIQKTEVLRVPFKNNTGNCVTGLKVKNKITIFFAGSIYAMKTVETFIGSLEEISVKTNFEVIFIIASKTKLNVSRCSFQIIQPGWLDEEQLKIYVEKSDFAYLPYSFEEKSSHQMTFAFHSKLWFYISNGLPIFFHGPSYSSVSNFINKYGIGVSCSSNTQKNTIFCLNTMIEAVEQKKNIYNKGIKELYHREFSEDVFCEKISKILS